MQQLQKTSSKAQALNLAAPASEFALAGALARNPRLLNGILANVDLTPADFVNPVCGTVFELVRDIQVIDANLLASKVKEKLGNVEVSVLGRFGALDLPLAVEHARQVRKMAVLRRFRVAAGALLKDSTEENAVRVGECLAEFFAVQKKKPAHIADAAARLLENLEKPARGINYGFCELDDWTGGMKPSEYILLAGRPGMGKTSFAVQVAFQAAREGKKVVFFSLEMSALQIVQKILSMQSGIPAQDIRKRKVSGDALAGYLQELADVPFWVRDDECRTPADIRAAAVNARNSSGLDLVVVDYLQAVKTGEKFTKEYDEVTLVSRSLSRLARELDIPVVALSQLSRESESRPGKRPTLADLRGSGALEQDADTVIFLYREKYYDKNAGDEAEIILAKQREGPTGTALAVFDPETTAFREFSPFE